MSASPSSPPMPTSTGATPAALPPSSPEPTPAPLPPSSPSPPSSPAPSEPTFVAAGASSLLEDGTTLELSTPSAIQSDDLLLALIDADEGAGPRTLAAPAGWTLVPGFPLHNLSSAHPPYVIPPSQSHGTWIFYKVVPAANAATASFEFATTATACGVMVGYRGVDPSAPIHDKSAYGFYGDGDTNGSGSGNTSLLHGRQVNLVATAPTAHPTYTVVKTGYGVRERFNSGEQPNGLNLVIHDESILPIGSFSIFTGVSIKNMQSPSASGDAFLFSGTTLVLKPN